MHAVTRWAGSRSTRPEDDRVRRHRVRGNAGYGRILDAAAIRERREAPRTLQEAARSPDRLGHLRVELRPHPPVDALLPGGAAPAPGGPVRRSALAGDRSRRGHWKPHGTAR